MTMNEGDPLVTALSLGVLMVFLEIFISGGDGFRTQEGVAQRVHAKSAGDGKIPSGWGPRPPPGNVHVSGPARARAGIMLANGLAVLIQ